MNQPPFTPRKIPGTHFCYRLSRLQGHSVAGRIMSTEKSNDFIGNRSHNLPACSIVPQATMLPHAPCADGNRNIILLNYNITWRFNTGSRNLPTLDRIWLLTVRMFKYLSFWLKGKMKPAGISEIKKGNIWKAKLMRLQPTVRTTP
jgi:hypothetical protein